MMLKSVAALALPRQVLYQLVSGLAIHRASHAIHEVFLCRTTASPSFPTR